MMSYFEFIDEFHVTDFSVERRLKGKTFLWKGVKWSSELIAKTTKDIGLYLGVETAAALPDNFCEPMEYRYSLLTVDNEVQCFGKCKRKDSVPLCFVMSND
jgi:hypothetical protein